MEKRKKQKKIIISIITLMVLTFTVVVTIYLYNEQKVKDQINEEWANKYYEYLKKKTDSKEEIFNMTDAKLNFYEIKKGNNPIMVISHKKNDKTYSNICHIKNSSVKCDNNKKPSEVKLLYKIETKEYNYYSKSEEENGFSIKKLNPYDNRLDNSDVYNFKNNEEESVTDVDGRKISISKYNNTFIEVETNDINIEYDKNLSNKELKNNIVNATNNYKSIEDILNEVASKTEKQLEEVLKKQEEMKKAQIEVENKKKKEEEEKRKEEAKKKEEERKLKEEAKNGLKIGNTTIKYGTYKGIDAVQGETLIISSNKTASINNRKYTYKIGTYNFAQDISSDHYNTAIIFLNSDKTTAFALFPYNGYLTDGGMSSYKYSGN